MNAGKLTLNYIMEQLNQHDIYLLITGVLKDEERGETEYFLKK